jgi:hypothetical protein
VRTLAALGMVCLAAFGHADRLIDTPTAHKVPDGMVRLEYDFDPAGPFHETYADFGIDKSFEMALRMQSIGDDPTKGTFDLAYNYVPPIAGISPGLSFGVQDALNETPDGRRFYAAVTTRQIYSPQGGDAPGDVTLGGYFAGARTCIFVGASLPLSPAVQFLAEDDGYRVSMGFEYHGIKQLAIRLVARGDQPVLSFSTRTRF